MAKDIRLSPRSHHAIRQKSATEAEHEKTTTPEQAGAPETMGAPLPTPPATPSTEAGSPSVTPSDVIPAHEPRDVVSSLLSSLIPAADDETDLPQVEEYPQTPDADLEALRAENAELRRQQEEYSRGRAAETEELERLRQQALSREEEELLNLHGVELENLDPDAARELTEKILRPALSRIRGSFDQSVQKVTQQFQQTQEQAKALQQQSEQREQRNKLIKINSAIGAEHPDFQKVIESREFKKYLRSTVANSPVTLGEMVAKAYNKGDSAFVNRVIAEFKGAKPVVANIASVPATQVGTQAPAPEQTTPAYTTQDVSEWNRQVSTGQISRTQYRENMKKYREG